MVLNLCLEGLAALWVVSLPGNAHPQDCGNQKHCYLIFQKVNPVFYNPRKNWRRVPKKGRERQASASLWKFC